MVNIDLDTDEAGFENLQNSLDELRDDWGESKVTWAVGSAVEYAVYLEYGTSKMDPKPFFLPAVEELKRLGVERFIEDNTETEVEAIPNAETLVATVAFALERRVKEIIRKKGLIDTGTLRASILAVPFKNIDDLPSADDFSGFSEDSPAPENAGRALVQTDIEVP